MRDGEWMASGGVRRRTGSLPGRDGPAAAKTPIELPLADLPDLLQTVHDKLHGFLALAEQWASLYAPALAPALIAKLNEDLNIGPPLEEPQIRPSASSGPVAWRLLTRDR